METLIPPEANALPLALAGAKYVAYSYSTLLYCFAEVGSPSTAWGQWLLKYHYIFKINCCVTLKNVSVDGMCKYLRKSIATCTLTRKIVLVHPSEKNSQGNAKLRKKRSNSNAILCLL